MQHVLKGERMDDEKQSKRLHISRPRQADTTAKPAVRFARKRTLRIYI